MTRAVEKASEVPGDAVANKTAAKLEAAKRIKAALALKATLSDHNPDLIAAIDAELAECRKIANGGLTTESEKKEAVEALATAEVKLSRAAKHLDAAKTNFSNAELEVQIQKSRIEALKSVMKKSQASLMIGCNAARTMATSLSDLKTSAEFTDDGRVVVDQRILERLSSQLESLATGASSRTSRSPASRQSAIKRKIS